MKLGEKIVRLRKKNGMSQERLADALDVSRQSVYKWEVNDSVPDMEKIAKMVEIFGVTYDFLLNDKIEFDETAVTEKVKEEAPLSKVNETQVEPETETVVEKAVEPEPLGECSICRKKIYEQGDLIVHEAQETYVGETRQVVPAWVECKECQNKAALKQRSQKLEQLKKTNKKAIIVGSIVAGVLLIACIIGLVMIENKVPMIVVTALVAVFIFPTFYSVMMDNTFIGEFWSEVASWGFVRMPGIIFSLDFNGIVFLIATKILLTILSITLAVACAALATVLAALFSPVCFPLSISRYQKEKKDLMAQIKFLRS